jgi:predicted Zn-dependent protease
MATQAGLEAVGAVASPQLLAILGAGAEVGIILPFSRTQETEADLIGLDLMASAGFDPRQSVVFWKNMEQTGDEGSAEFLSTHPAGETRIAKLEERIPRAMQLFERARANGKRPTCPAS